MYAESVVSRQISPPDSELFGIAGNVNAIVFGPAGERAARGRDSVRATCEAIGLPRSTFYYQSHRSGPNIALEQKIVLRLYELRQCFPKEGYRRITQRLQAEGLHVNPKRISRLMSLHGLSARGVQPPTAFTLPDPPPSQISQRSDASVPGAQRNTRIAHIAYVRIRVGLVYLAVVIDAGTEEVLGYALAPQLNQRLLAIALHCAVRARRPRLRCVHHSTCRVPYLMKAYLELLEQYGLVAATSTASSDSPQIIEMPDYHNWQDVSKQAQRFVRDVYSRERIVEIVGV